MDSVKQFRKILMTMAILLVVILIFVGVNQPSQISYADTPTSYTDYLQSLDEDDLGDWYFGENFLDIYNCIEIVNSWRNDSNFDWDKLASDPIVVAVIDSGIGYAYTIEDGNEVECAPAYVYNSGNNYKISPIFDDVLLKDEDGNYVYCCTAQKVKMTDDNVNSTRTIDAIYNSGNIACDLVDNSDNNHGTHVTATIALMIKMFGLEDYIKIMPIKANNVIKKAKNKTQFIASYDNGTSTPVISDAIDFALNNGADIVNLSLAAPSGAKTYYTFGSIPDEMLFVASAGNEGKNSIFASSCYYPAASDNVLGVMNYMMSDDDAVLYKSGGSMTNYGPAYDIAAPGTGIISIIDGNETYGKLTGTSMAAPITSFCAALTLLRYRAIEDSTGIEITPKLLRTLITASATETTQDIQSEPILNLKNLITVDFFNDEEYEDKLYTTPVGIKIVTDSSNYQILGNESIVLKSKPIPSNSKTDDVVYWYYTYNDERFELGYGEEITIELPQEIGEGYKVYCQFRDSETDVVNYECAEPFVFSVNYKTIDVDAIVDFGEIIEENKTKYSFSIPVEYCNPETLDNIVWYINGEEVGRGATLDYEFSEVGVFTVSAKVNDEEIDYKFTVEFVAPEPEYTMNDIYTIIGGCVVVLGILGFVGALIYNEIRKKHPKMDEFE